MRKISGKISGVEKGPEIFCNPENLRKNFRIRKISADQMSVAIITSMKNSLKSVPSLADAGVPLGVEDGPRAPP